MEIPKKVREQLDKIYEADDNQNYIVGLQNQYIVLEMMLKNKQITDLKTQVKFELQPSFKFKGKTIRSINYIADFTYMKDGKLIIVDTKGYRTEVYKLKKKMMQYKGLEVKEI